MLNKKNKKDKINEKDLVKLVIFGLIFIFMLGYVLFSSPANATMPKKDKKEYNNVNLLEILEKINNNYDVHVTINSQTKFDYSTDGIVKLFSTDSNEEGYMVYDNHTFYIDIELNIKRMDIPSYLLDSNVNFELIKNNLTLCDIKNTKEDEVECTFNDKTYNVKLHDSIDSISIYDKISQNSYYIEIDNINKNDYSELVEYYNETYN